MPHTVVCTSQRCVGELPSMCLCARSESSQRRSSTLLHCSTSCPSRGRHRPPPGHSSKVAAGQSSPSAYPAHMKVYKHNTKSVGGRSRATPVRARGLGWGVQGGVGGRGGTMLKACTVWIRAQTCHLLRWAVSQLKGNLWTQDELQEHALCMQMCADEVRCSNILTRGGRRWILLSICARWGLFNRSIKKACAAQASCAKKCPY